MIKLLENILAHRHRTVLRSKVRRHNLLKHYRENKRIDLDETGFSPFEALYWELSITLGHRVFSRDSLEDSLESSILHLEHEIQHHSEKLHGLGHSVFSCPHDCPTDKTLRAEKYYHPRCGHCSTAMVPQKL